MSAIVTSSLFWGFQPSEETVLQGYIKREQSEETLTLLIILHFIQYNRTSSEYFDTSYHMTLYTIQ